MKGKKYLYETWSTRAPFALKAHINSAYNTKCCVFSCATLLQPIIFYFKGRLLNVKSSYANVSNLSLAKLKGGARRQSSIQYGTWGRWLLSPATLAPGLKRDS